jgi:hypothetical protein
VTVAPMVSKGTHRFGVACLANSYSLGLQKSAGCLISRTGRFRLCGGLPRSLSCGFRRRIVVGWGRRGFRLGHGEDVAPWREQESPQFRPGAIGLSRHFKSVHRGKPTRQGHGWGTLMEEVPVPDEDQVSAMRKSRAAQRGRVARLPLASPVVAVPAPLGGRDALECRGLDQRVAWPSRLTPLLRMLRSQSLSRDAGDNRRKITDGS